MVVTDDSDLKSSQPVQSEIKNEIVHKIDLTPLISQTLPPKQHDM